MPKVMELPTHGSKYQMWRTPLYAGLKSNNLKKSNDYSFPGNPFYHWLPGYCEKFLVHSPQDLIGKERGRNNFHNYASRLQGIFVRSSISKSSK